MSADNAERFLSVSLAFILWRRSGQRCSLFSSETMKAWLAFLTPNFYRLRPYGLAQPFWLRYNLRAPKVFYFS